MKWRKSQFKDSPLVVFSETHSDSCGMAANTIAADQFIKHHNADIDVLRAQLAACAAGPWRTDVKNAPRNGSEVWCEFEELGTTLQVSAGWSNDHHAWFDGFGRSYSDTLLTAFAVPNPPQVKP